MNWKVPLMAAAGALLGASALMASANFAAQRAARREAGAQIREAQVGAGEALRALVVEARDALQADPAPDRPPPPFKSVWSVRGDDALDAAVGARHEPIRSSALGGVLLGFGARQGLHVAVPVEGQQGAWLVGRVPGAEVARRIEADAHVGPPGARWGRLQLVGRAGEVLLTLPEPKEGAETRRQRRRTFGTDVLARIREGKPCAYGAEGTPPSYKDADDERMLACWGGAPDLPGLYALVEVSDARALGSAAGMPIGLLDFKLGEAHPWHLVLGAGVLCLVLAAFFFLPSRGADIGVLLRVYRFARPYAWGIAGVVLVGFLFGVTKSSRALLMKDLVDGVFVKSGPEAAQRLWVLAGALVALGLAIAVTGYLKEYLQNYYATAMIADIRVALARKIVSLPLSFFNRIRAGDLVARIERDVASTRGVLNQVFDKACVQPMILMSSVVFAFVMNWRLALVLLGMPILVYPLFRIAKRIKKRAEKRQNLLADISHVLFQMLMGIKVVKAFAGEEREADRLDAANRRFIRQARRIHRLSALSESLLDLLQMVGGAILIVVGGFGVIEGEVTAGDLAGFLLVVAQVYDASKDITSVLNKFIDALPGTKRVFEIFDTGSDLVDGPRDVPPGPLAKGIELRGVRFRYLEKDVVRGVDLSVPAGKVVAIVGPTGAGKTTVCDLIARFYDPTEGQVLYDGVDVREFRLKSLASKLAIVTQDAFLFNAPLDENIRYGKPDASEEEVEAAARAANVHDEIVQMDGGYRKMAGERGSALSGGQRQRVTIARALLKDAPVLVLDEATSSLDTQAETRVQAALARLMEGRTVIVVAHRLSTIRHADKVVVMDDGRVVEEGPPDELLARPGGRFRAMYELQLGDGGAGAAAS